MEIPAWMLDRASCCRMRMADAPVVSCEALRYLQGLLDWAAASLDLRQARHLSLSMEEDADVPLAHSLKAHQLNLFQPLRNSPDYRTLPPEVKQRMMPLLARLLREHLAKQLGGVPDREARDE